VALDKKTGKIAWKSEGDSSYASPVPFALGGKRYVALFTATGLVVVSPASGQKIVSYDWKTKDNSSCSDPLIVGDKIFITSQYGTGCALVSISGEKASLVWKKKYECHYASPVLVGDCIYALVVSGWLKADLVCISVKDGSLQWTQKDVGAGGLLVLDKRLLILSRNGELILAEASPTAYTELGRAKAFPEEPAGPRAKPIVCWSGPVLCNGRVYVHDDRGTLVCLDFHGK